MLEELLTVAELSRIVKVKPAGIYEMVRQNKLPAVHLGERQIRFLPSQIADFFAAGGNNNKANGSPSANHDGGP